MPQMPDNGEATASSPKTNFEMRRDFGARFEKFFTSVSSLGGLGRLWGLQQ
jgi:hypothetical protein